jgi:choline dehydrogenase
MLRFELTKSTNCLPTGIIGTSGIEGIGTFPASNSTTGPDGMLILFNMGSIDAAIYSKVANIRIEAFRRWFPKSDNFWQEGFVLISVCLHPRSRGHIRIKSTDPLQPPEIDPQYLSHPDDVQCLANSKCNF